MIGEEIPQSSKLKFIGVEFDARWTFVGHVKRAISRAWGSIGMMNGLLSRKYVDLVTKCILY